MVREEGVPRGYKKTEVGVIPEEWELRRLGEPELASIDSENLTAKTDPSYLFAYISLEDVYEGVLTGFTEMIFKNAPSRARRRIRKGDVLLSTVRPNLKSHFLVSTDHRDLVCSTGFSVIRCNEKQVFCSYMYYHLFYRIIDRQINALLTGSNYPAINSKDVRTLLIPFPTLPEQKVIAEVLSDVDELIVSIGKLIDKKQKIKQGTMQLLLTGKKRLLGFAERWELERLGDSGYKKTEVGMIPKDWEVKKVKALGEVVTGGTPSTDTREFWEGTIPWVTPTDIGSQKNISHTERQITNVGLSKLRKLPVNSVLVTCIASIGKNAILEKEGACNQQINAIVANSEHSPDFLYYLMDGNRQCLLCRAGATATSIIPKKVFSQILFAVPPLPEQNAIAQILSDMDSEIEALEKKLNKYKLIKEGMMEELLTGKVRLV